MSPVCTLINLMSNNEEVQRNLKQYFPNYQIIQGSVLKDEKEMNRFGLKVRASAASSLVLARVEANDKKTSEKITLVSNIINDGFLLLFRFGIYSKGTLATFKTKTIIVTGRSFDYLS